MSHNYSESDCVIQDKSERKRLRIQPVRKNKILNHFLTGIFGSVQHVFLVGCGGAVPDFHDYNKHTRLGDVAVSMPDNPEGMKIKLNSAS